MKLIVTADLHYDIIRSMEPARRIAEEICGLHADALLVLGDVGGWDVDIIRDCLHLFDRFAGRRFFVAGNHDIWTDPDQDSLERLERTLPELCREVSFHPLDAEPVVVEGVGMVGSMGWYDFSFRVGQLGIPMRFYEAKVAPGAAARLPGYEHLLADPSDVPEAALEMGSRWMDGENVHLSMSDPDFCHRLVERFRQHLDQAAQQSDTIVVGMHHLPFQELVPDSEDPARAFAAAFMGSGLFGEVLLAQPKVRYVFCGHSHRLARVRCGHIDCIDVGCSYAEKRYEMIEL